MTMGERVRAQLLVASVLTFAARAQAQEEPEAPASSPPVAPEAVPPPEEEAAPAPALPPSPPPRFGERGEYVVSAASELGLFSQKYAKSARETFDVRVSPGLDVFVVRNFSIGVDLDIGYEATTRPPNAQLGSTKTTSFALGPRFGWNVPLGARFSFYPRLTLGFASVSATREVTGSADESTSEQWIRLSAFAPVLFHAAPHFFFGAGPSFNHSFPENGLSGSITSVAGRVLVGGWWGGNAKNEAPTPSSEPEDTPRFGERGQWVFTGDVGGRFAYTKGSASTVANESRTTVSVTPGADLFVVSHLSVGVATLVSYTETESSSRTAFGVGPRVGAEIPISRAFSLYPRVIVSYAHVNSTAKSASAPYLFVSDAATSTSAGDVVTLGAYVPLLAHVAPHFFIGFGPSFVHDLSRSFGNDTGDLGTRIGASLEVGGWL